MCVEDVCVCGGCVCGGGEWYGRMVWSVWRVGCEECGECFIKAQASMTMVYHSLSKLFPKRMFSLRVPEKTQGSWEA